MLSRIMHWAEQVENIRAIIMVGSHANTGKQDELSDYDLSIFGHQFDFIRQDDWQNRIATLSLCIHDKFSWGDWQIPTRLCLFENHAKVDFSFHPLSLLESMVNAQKLNPTYDAGYRVLLDKDSIAAQLPDPTFQAYKVKKPTVHEFQICQDEFWFEAYHVAKYIFRNDLWTAIGRDHDLKKWLLKMLEWDAAIKKDFALQAKGEGKCLREWISPSYLKRLPDCFSGWNASDQRKALLESLDLFRELAKATASALNMSYQEKADQDITAFISKLTNLQDGKSKIQSI
jgi:aminoglycoside 6-adenylyltransferase